MTVGVYELTKTWTYVPHVNSWIKNTLTTNWTTPGGDYGKKITSLVVPKLPTDKFVTFDVLTGVKDWVANPAGNFGMILIPEGGNGGDGNQYLSSTNSDAAKRPKLTIVYTGGTGTLYGRGNRTAGNFPAISSMGRTLSYRLAGESADVITIVNSIGRSVLTRTVTGTGSLDLGMLSAGTYYARLGGRAGVMPLVIGW